MRVLLIAVLAVASGCCDYCWSPPTHEQWDEVLHRDGVEVRNHKKWCEHHWRVRFLYDDIDDGK